MQHGGHKTGDKSCELCEVETNSVSAPAPSCAIVATSNMSFLDRIQKDLTDAMKSKDELRLSVLRMVKTALKHKEIEKMRPIEDAEALQILQTLIKQRKESAEQFARGGRAAVGAVPARACRVRPCAVLAQ